MLWQDNEMKDLMEHYKMSLVTTWAIIVCVPIPLTNCLLFLLFHLGSRSNFEHDCASSYSSLQFVF